MAQVEEIAKERIRRLFELADSRMRSSKKDLADRYVELARRIGMKYNVSIPGNLRKKFCHKCGSYLRPGLNCQVRINSKKGNINYHCKECKEVNRYGI